MAEEHPIPTSKRFKNLAGRPFGKLTALFYAGKAKNKSSLWVCQCKCGRITKPIQAANLKNGNTTSCGCERNRKSGSRVRTHGKRKTPEYGVWWAMINRCHRKGYKQYDDYGGRGIVVCERWRESFADFIADMGPRPSPKHQLDRKGNDGPYSPNNCRWATKREQMLNRRDNRRLTAHGETLTMTEWGERLGIDPKQIWSRIDRGWPVEDAVTLRRGQRCQRIRRSAKSKNKDAARQAVGYAIKTGKLTKPPHCEAVGCASTDTQAHHFLGYAPRHRLDVCWLCRKHHYAFDRT